MVYIFIKSVEKMFECPRKSVVESDVFKLDLKTIIENPRWRNTSFTFKILFYLVWSTNIWASSLLSVFCLSSEIIQKHKEQRI